MLLKLKPAVMLAVGVLEGQWTSQPGDGNQGNEGNKGHKGDEGGKATMAMRERR